MKTNASAPGASDAPGSPGQPGAILYQETLSSRGTAALFLALALLFLLLLSWRASRTGLDLLFYIFCALCAIFLFYVLNYRSLHIQLSSQALRLQFGLFSWSVPLDNITACRIDYVPPVLAVRRSGHPFHVRRQTLSRLLQLPGVSPGGDRPPAQSRPGARPVLLDPAAGGGGEADRGG